MKYEAMFIFPGNLNEEQVEESLEKVQTDIQNAGGLIEGVARLGKRSFARPLKGLDHGYYAVLNIDIAGTEIKKLHARFKLDENVLRVFFVLAGAVVEEVNTTDEVAV